ncbi:MAG: sulfatase [Hyphomicrobiaceae bacterium]
MQKPNILWICTDQQRWDTLSYFGFPGADTPNIDRLARKGVAFERTYCQSPICTPSRASFLTGRYPISHQNHRNGNTSFSDKLVLVPRLFQDAGYATGLIGKLHLSRSQGVVEQRPSRDGYTEFYWSHHPDPDWGEGHDYETWLAEKGVDPETLYNRARAYGPGVEAPLHQTTWAGDRAQDFIERHKDRPWFLSINLFDPHPPFDPPADYLARFDPKDMPAPIFAPSDMDHQRAFQDIDQQIVIPVDPRRGDPDSDLFENPPLVSDSPGRDTPPSLYNARYIRACYHAMILLIDDMVGDLMAKLTETGQERDTIVLFMSDHGEMLGDHGILYKGCRFYEGMIRVPMIFAWPGQFEEGLVSGALTELVDIAPTILDAAGLPSEPAMQGRSLAPLLRGTVPADRHKDHVLCEYFDSLDIPQGKGTRASMFRDERYKLCVYHGTGLGELYDLESDPQELNSLWDDESSQELKAALLARHFDAMMLASGAGPQRTASY